MGNLETVIIPTVLSIVASIISACITSYLSRKNDIKKSIYEVRKTLYISCMDKLDSIVGNYEKVYDKEYFEIMKEFKAQIKLVASQKTKKMYSKYFEMIWNYQIKKEKDLYEKDPTNKLAYDDEGNAYYRYNFSADMESYESYENNYDINNCPDKEEQHIIKDALDLLNEQMRKDIGSDV